MLNLEKNIGNGQNEFEADLEFWPKQAEEFLKQHQYDKVIEICRRNRSSSHNSVAAKLIYSRALVKTEQSDEAIEQLYQVLAVDPDNVVALKILGDIRFAQKDVVSAMASYSRIMEIDPDCRGIKSDLPVREPEPKTQLVLHRAPETAPAVKELLIERPFRTETVGDIYMAQGQPRLAMEIFKELADLHQNQRMRDKLASAEKMLGVRERRDVEQQN